MKRIPNDTTMQNTDSNSLRWTWRGALGCLALAGSTGALIRFGLLYGFPLELQYANVRHAHSHLMILGWVTPALMALIIAWLPRVTGRPLSAQLQTRFRVTMVTIFVLALLAYASFLFYGYQAMPNGLPLSAMAAGLNMLAWYVFIYLYWQATRGIRRSVLPLRLWDAALAFLTLASMGAWGIAVVARLQLQNPLWSLALTHLFLDLLAEGWLVLGVLGLAHATQPAAATHLLARHGETLLVTGLPVVFLLAIPVNMVPTSARAVGSLGGVLVALGLVGQLATLWPATSTSWKPPLAFLGLKTVTGFIVTIPTAALWVESAGLRISYLHWLLLGFVTLGLIAAAEVTWGKVAVRGRRWLTVAVIVLLLTLIPLTRLWPTVLSGRWAFVVAAWATLGPVTAAIAMLLATRRQWRKDRLEGAHRGNREIGNRRLHGEETEKGARLVATSQIVRGRQGTKSK